MKELKGVPKKWAIQTNRQEFYDWVNANKFQSDVDALPVFLSETLVHINLESAYSFWFGTDSLNLGYELITFERWASVYRPDLVEDQAAVDDFASKLADELNASEDIPKNWCVKRTPENAEMLNAWQLYKKGKSPRTQFINNWVNQNGSEWNGWDPPQEPEITFNQWQTIPEVAEWLFNYYVPDTSKRTEKVEERELSHFQVLSGENVPREIIGYEPAKPFEEKAMNNMWVKGDFGYTDSVDGDTMSTELFERIIEAGIFKPVYADKPVFKVGEYATFKGKDTFKIAKITEHYLHADGETGYLKECCTVATPEEIEAARPKLRKYMKQVWYVLVMDENFNSLMVSKQHETEELAHQWELENSEEGKVYSVKPFEVVAYE